MAEGLFDPRTRAVVFHESGDARVPYVAIVDSAQWAVRINEFPEEPSLYTLLIDGVASVELLEWPPAWSRP